MFKRLTTEDRLLSPVKLCIGWLRQTAVSRAMSAKYTVKEFGSMKSTR